MFVGVSVAAAVGVFVGVDVRVAVAELMAVRLAVAAVVGVGVGALPQTSIVRPLPGLLRMSTQSSLEDWRVTHLSINSTRWLKSDGPMI